MSGTAQQLGAPTQGISLDRQESANPPELVPEIEDLALRAPEACDANDQDIQRRFGMVDECLHRPAF
jgi:hypothetical protein